MENVDKIVITIVLDFPDLVSTFILGCLLAAFVIVGILAVFEDIKYKLIERRKNNKVIQK